MCTKDMSLSGIEMVYFTGGMEIKNSIFGIYYVVLNDSCPYSILGKNNFYGRIENQTASSIYFSSIEPEDNSLIIVLHDWIQFMTPIKVYKSKE